MSATERNSAHRPGRALNGTDVRCLLGLSAAPWARARAIDVIPNPDRSGPRWSAALVADLVRRRDALVAAIPELVDSYQLRSELGWDRGELYRARSAGMVPPPDHGAFWSRSMVDTIVAEAAQLRPMIPTQPVVADQLTELCGQPVFALDVDDLAAAGHLSVVDHYRDRPLYHPDQAQAIASTDAGRALIDDHHLLGPHQAAELLGIRRVDIDHLVSGRSITPATHITSRAHLAQVKIAMYRTGELNRLAGRPDLDWLAIRATRPGQRSAVPPNPDGVCSYGGGDRGPSCEPPVAGTLDGFLLLDDGTWDDKTIVERRAMCAEHLRFASRIYHRTSPTWNLDGDED